MWDRRASASAALVCLIAAATGASFWLWRTQERASIADAGVPEVPDLSRWPAGFARAVEETGAAIRDARDPVEPLAQLAGLYYANTYDAQATQVLDALRRLDPTNARWVYLLAALRLREGDRDAAEEALRQTSELDPSYLPAWFSLAEILAKRGAIDAARECYARAVEVAPQDVRAAYFQIGFEAIYGDAAQARRRLTELAQANPGIAELHALLAELNARAGDRAGEERERRLASTAGRELTHADPWVDEWTRYCFDVERLSVLAQEAARERQFDHAENLLKRAIEIDPSEPSSWQYLQLLYQQMGRPEDALRVLEQAAASSVDDPELRAEQANLLCTQGRADDALSLLQQSLQRWPDAAPLHASRGFVLGRSGKPQAAVFALREAVRLDPTLVDAQFYLAVSLREIDQVAASRAAVERALAMRPEYPDALAWLARIALETDDLATAEATLSQLMRVRPDAESDSLFASLQLLKGAHAEQSGDAATAAELYRKGLEVAPEDGPLLRAAGILALRAQRHREAIDAFERYRRSDPGNPDAYLLLGNALQRAGRVDDARRTLQEGLRLSRQAGREQQAARFRRALERLRTRNLEAGRDAETAS